MTAKVSNESSSSKVIQRAPEINESVSNGREWKDISWCDANKSQKLVIAAKMLLVALVVAAVITAIIYTGGAAAAAVGLAHSALFSTTIGLSICAVTIIPFSAYVGKMNKYTENNLKDMRNYFFAAVGGTIVVTSFFFLIGRA